MKIVRYYWTQGGRLYPIELDSELVQHVKWNRAETLKVEIWPFDLKVGPSTQIPYGKRREQFKQTLDEFINRPEEERKRPYQNLSYGSTKRARHILRNLPNEMTHEIGLTYPRKFPRDGSIVKDHLHKMMLRFNYRGIRVFWFMEFQERGACHFHLISDKEIEEDELKRMWYEIVGSNDKRHREHGAHIAPIRKPEAFKKYLSAYLTKEEQKRVPYFYENAGRFWGYSRSLIKVQIAIIVGPKYDILRIRKNLRIFRRWQKARYRKWNKGPITSKKMKNINSYVFVLPGEYLFIADARKLIDAIKGTPYDSELFEDW